jgi:4-amino-4-deoxy-L-arabinose transferase-like glycosyltransferase
MVPHSPPGFSLHAALAVLAAGWVAGPFVVSPIAAILCLLFTYLVARELSLSRPLASVAAAVVGACPVFLKHAVLPMSDVVAAAWATAAVLAALLSRRGSDVWAGLAGAAFGIAVLVRPSNALLAFPLAFALRWRPKTAALFALGGLPFAAFFAAWNRAAYGTVFRTGYSHRAGGEFALSHFPHQFRHYGFWIAAQLSPLPLLGWLGSLADRRIPGRDRLLLGSWFASFFLFYGFWGPADAWWHTRYLLPALPALVIGFLLALRDLLRLVPARDDEPAGERRPYRALAAAAALLVVFLFEWQVALRYRPLEAGRGRSVFPEACQALAQKVAGGRALVLSMEFSGAVRFYTELTPVRWDALDPEDFALLRRRAAEKGDRIFAVLLPQEVHPAARQAPGPWVFVGNVREATLWELPPGS